MRDLAPLDATVDSPPAVGRRGFLASAGALVIGITLGPVIGGRAWAKASDLKDHGQGDARPKLFIEIRADGDVVLTCHRSEMGQHVWTAIAQMLGEELEVDWSRVRIAQAIGHPKYGDQNTDGSRSVRNNFDRLRLAGAAMRTMLVTAAAQKWGVSPDACSAAEHVVTHGKSGRTLGYGTLAASAAKLPVPATESLKLKAPENWRLINKPMPSLTVPDIITGKARYGADVRLPGMRFAVIARPPRVFAKASAVDDAATLKVPGVLQTVSLQAPKPPVAFKPLGGVAVVAENTWAAIKGRDALAITWDEGPHAGYDSDAYEKLLWEQVRKPGRVRRNRGDTSKALSEADSDGSKRVTAEYYAPHLAHAPMEPPAVVARWTDDKVELWGCVQTPQAARSTVAKACGVEPDQVTVNVTLLGGGFGRKSKPDFFAEAALVARAAKAPVMVMWTREDDLLHGYYHSVSAQRLEAALDDKGRCTAWLHRTVFPPIPSTFSAGADEPSTGELRLGASDTPFDVPNLRLETGKAPAHVRIGWLRSVSNIYHAFAIHSFADELAHAAGRDPLDYLLELIGPPRKVDPNTEGAEYDNYGSSLKDYPIDTGRMAHVVRKVAEMSGWRRRHAAKLKPGHGLGIAVHRSFVSYVATVVEVAVNGRGELTIPAVWTAMDAGTVVNTRHATAQLEGGTLFGISNALFGAITAKAGVIEQSNFPQFRVMRMNESPRTVQTHIVPSTAPPGGVGEPSTPPAAPALANAIFAATGQRVRRLPLLGTDRRNRIAPRSGAQGGKD